MENLGRSSCELLLNSRVYYVDKKAVSELVAEARRTAFVRKVDKLIKQKDEELTCGIAATSLVEDSSSSSSSSLNVDIQYDVKCDSVIFIFDFFHTKWEDLVSDLHQAMGNLGKTLQDCHGDKGACESRYPFFISVGLKAQCVLCIQTHIKLSYSSCGRRQNVASCRKNFSHRLRLCLGGAALVFSNCRNVLELWKDSSKDTKVSVSVVCVRKYTYTHGFSPITDS